MKIFIFIFIFSFIHCSFLHLNSTKNGVVNVFKDNFSFQIQNNLIWDLLSQKPKNSLFSDTQIVKTILFINTNLLVFIKTKKFSNHYEWLQQYHKEEKLEEFNTKNYKESSEREFVLGTLTKFNSRGIYTFELCPEDDLPSNKLLDLMKLLKSKVYFDLHFRTNSIESISSSKILGNEFKITSTDSLYKGTNFIPYYLSKGVGFLKFLKRNDKDYDFKFRNITERDIVICDHIPNYFPYSAGIITSEFQSPLSHIVLLSTNRKIPNAFIRNIFETLKYKEHELVNFQVKKHTFILERLMNYKFKKQKYPKVSIPKVTFDSKSLIDLKSCKIGWCGFKASKLNQYKYLDSKNVTIFNLGKVIPFGESNRHLSQIWKKNTEINEIFENIDSIKMNPILMNRLKDYMKDGGEYIFVISFKLNSRDPVQM
jgi:hypothetical protein